MQPTVLLFDIDGTLINCGGAGRRAMETAFRDLYGRDDVFDFSFAGGTDPSIMRQALSLAGIEPTAGAVERLLGLYLEHLVPELVRSEAYAVFAGVRDVLDRLEGRTSFAVGLGTGNLEAGAYLKLRRGDLAERFTFGGFGSDAEDRARLLAVGAARGAARLGQALEACRVVVIGDTPKDIAAARAIGAECLAVTTGPHGASELRELGASLVVGDLASAEAHAFLGLPP